MGHGKTTRDEDHAATILSSAANTTLQVRGQIAVASNWLGGNKFTDLSQRASNLSDDLRDASNELWRITE